ncbi:UNVERIFIED_CONTAM: hypothetical protein Slati_4258300 [Sesamum latifolium]|uniref:Uncharacterized protein n=1 Tax=Sesamum latifolium TaxID=2727402 RepID=A0AAW2TBW2_9LAMI
MSAEVSEGTAEESPLAVRGVPSPFASCPPSLRASPSTESVAAGEGPLTSASTSPRRLSRSSSAENQ